MRYLFIIGFVLMVAAQWYAPLSMVYASEETIDQGAEYKFLTAPVDPSDPFRGKYITLAFDAETYHPRDTNETHFEPDQQVYAVIAQDGEFASIDKLLAAPPELALPYMGVTFKYSYKDYDTIPIIMLDFPFKRFYVEESKASEAEQYYWYTTRNDSAMNCYGKVMIHEGNATLVDVMVNEKSLIDIVREMNSSNE